MTATNMCSNIGGKWDSPPFFFPSHVDSIESPQTLSEEELEQILDVWNRNPR